MEPWKTNSKGGQKEEEDPARETEKTQPRRQEENQKRVMLQNQSEESISRR